VLVLPRFRFKNRARYAVHLPGADKRLLIPREEIVDNVLIRQVATEQRLFQVVDRTQDIGWHENGPAGGIGSNFPEEHGFAFPIFRIKHLIYNLGGTLRPAFLNLKLERFLCPLISIRRRTYETPFWRNALSSEARSLVVIADGVSAAREEKASVRPIMAAVTGTNVRRNSFKRINT
jgi:hypothetical protein